MAERKNYWTQSFGTQDSLVQHGAVSSEKECISDYKLTGSDAEHFIDLKKDGPMSKSTTMSSPGATQIETGRDLVEGANAIFLMAKNGDIVIKDAGEKKRPDGDRAFGNIRFECDNFEIVARENINVSGRNIDITADNNLNIETKLGKITSIGLFEVHVNCGMAVYGGMIEGISCATKDFSSYFDF